MNNIAESLRSWAQWVEQGYEVPAAGQVMRDAAMRIDENETLQEHYKSMLSYLRAYDFLDRDPGGYLKQMLIDGEKITSKI